jgi:retron-type reverse transcriptase
MLHVLQERWDPTFSEHSYGFRPGRLCSQFTNAAFTGVLENLDGSQGRWMDNVFIERLWRSLKYEDLSKAYAVGFEAKIGIGR